MMKSIKNLAVVILIGVVLVVGVSAYGQISMTDQQRFLRRQLETTKISNQIATAQAWGQIRLALVYVAGGTLGILMVAGSGLILSFVGKYTRTLRAVDGLYPVIVERPGLFARLQGKRDPIVVDPNKQTGPVARYREVPGGVQMIAPIDNEATQATATAAAQRVQMVQAMNSGRMSAAAGRFFAGAYDPRQPATVLDEPPALAAPQQEPAFLDRLIANPSQNGEIVLGQAEARGFERATWRPVAVPHLAIWGSTQQGKTTGMGYTVAMQLIAAGHHVVIIDPEEEANWAKLDGWAEYHPTDPAQFPAQIAALAEEYERRGSVLARYGAPNWVKLPDRSGERRMVLIVEEYGRIRTQAGDYGNLAEIDRVMGELATRGGKRGMHMVLVDQHYKGQWGKWPDPVFNNIGARATFRQPKEDNSLVGYHGLAFLGVGNFAYEGRTFNTFHAEPHVAKLMANVPALDARPLLGVSSSGSSAVRSFGGWEAPPPSGRSTPPLDRTTEPNEPPNFAAWTVAEPEETELVQAARAWIAANPTGRQVDMSQALAPHNGGEPVSKGYTSELWHKCHPAGREYTPAPGVMTVLAAEVETAQPAGMDWAGLDKATLLDLMESVDPDTAAQALIEWGRRGERISYGGS